MSTITQLSFFQLFPKINSCVAAAPVQLSTKIIDLCNKTKDIWIQLLPYIESAILFCFTPIGISVAVIGLSILPLRLSQSCSSRLASIAWLIVGIATATFGIGLLSTTGVIPPLPWITTIFIQLI